MIFTVISVGYGALERMLQQAYAACIQDEDWPDKPCLDEPPYSEEYLRQIWQQYYKYKGKEWMDMKKAEMDQAIVNGRLSEWVETRSSPNNFANHNVWSYYYVNGKAPDAIQTWSQPEGGALYSEILIYANFCSVFENYDYADVHLNITSMLERPDGQTEELSEFAEVNENDCERT